MRIEFEVVEDHMRQYHADNADNGDDLSRQFTWLRLPDDVRRGMLQVLGRMSLDDIVAKGVPRETAIKVMDIYFALM